MVQVHVYSHKGKMFEVEYEFPSHVATVVASDFAGLRVGEIVEIDTLSIYKHEGLKK